MREEKIREEIRGVMREKIRKEKIEDGRKATQTDYLSFGSFYLTHKFIFPPSAQTYCGHFLVNRIEQTRCRCVCVCVCACAFVFVCVWRKEDREEGMNEWGEEGGRKEGRKEGRKVGRKRNIGVKASWKCALLWECVCENCPNINVSETNRMWQKAYIHEQWAEKGMQKVCVCLYLCVHACIVGEDNREVWYA